MMTQGSRSTGAFVLRTAKEAASADIWGLTATLVILSLVAFPACGGRAASTPERGPELRVRWALPDAFPAQVSLHRALPDQPSGQMRTYAADERVVAGEVIADGNMRVTLDELQRVVVVLRNPFDRPVRFWVAPHLPTPPRAEAALMTRCLCTGETYDVPARGTWTRVIELGVRRRQAVDVLVVTHVVTLGDAPSLEAEGPREHRRTKREASDPRTSHSLPSDHARLLRMGGASTTGLDHDPSP